MCHFVTIAVPHGHEAQVEQVRREYGYRTWPCANRSVASALSAGLSSFDVAVDTGMGPCSCDFIPSAPDPQERARRLRSAESKYRRLGWSDPKIRRALAAKAASGDSRAPDPQVRRFRLFVERLVNDVGVVWLFIHFYNGAIEAEAIEVGASQSVDLPTLTSDEWQYPEDVPLRVVRGAA